jgi:hypothetical protein
VAAELALVFLRFMVELNFLWTGWLLTAGGKTKAYSLTDLIIKPSCHLKIQKIQYAHTKNVKMVNPQTRPAGAVLTLSVVLFPIAATAAWTFHPCAKTLVRPLPFHASIGSRLYAEKDESSPLDWLNPFGNDRQDGDESSLSIPKEAEKEIYEAEGNTVAARERTQRIGLYGAVAVVGILSAFFNAFITELATSSSSGEASASSADLHELFPWAFANPVVAFLLTTKLGGGFMLVCGAVSALLIEAEFSARRDNAQKIYAELIRRRERAAAAKERGTKQAKNKGLSGKEAKRLAALAEVVETADYQPPPVSPPPIGSADVNETGASSGGDVLSSLLNPIQEFYQKADRMAASQALLLNKELEDRGILEKITDEETGLKIVGRKTAKGDGPGPVGQPGEVAVGDRKLNAGDVDRTLASDEQTVSTVVTSVKSAEPSAASVADQQQGVPLRPSSPVKNKRRKKKK